MSKTVAGIDLSSVKAGPLREVAEWSRTVAAEGCVLLENRGGLLPLKDGAKVSVFGRMQKDYIKSGAGSGGAVNAPYLTNILDELRAEGGVVINEDLAEAYADYNAGHPYDKGKGWADAPWSQVEMPLSDELLTSAAEQSDIALVIITRTSGEARDNVAEAGSYFLSESEEEMFAAIKKHFDKVAVLLNVGNIMDMNWVKKYDIDSVMYVWQGGQEGGRATVDVIRGKVNPCGKLPDTIVNSFDVIPSTPYFGDHKRNCFSEDIYVGYRYFETVAPDAVLYPFGYGISYTTFKTETVSVTDRGGRIEATVRVTNTGDCAGKEVVQVYYGAPQGKLGKPLKQLAAFKKTRLLAPNESEELTVGFDIDSMASYDDSGVTGNAYAYVLEAGDYDIYVGNDAHSCEKVYTYPISELVVTEQLEQALAPTFAFDRFRMTKDADGYRVVMEPAPLRQYDILERIAANRPADIPYTGDKGLILNDVKTGKCSMEEFIAQLSDDDLIHISRGEGMSSPKVTGTGSAYGGITDRLMQFGIPVLCSSDGPSGLRMPGKIQATAMPNGTQMASTWDCELIEKLFVYEGIEMYGHRVDTLLGPGINIHRSPLNGRNFEYFSEDPLLSGLMAAAQCRGLLESDVTATIKHFCANSQETTRNTHDSVVSERALREIYLRPFEIAVKEGGATSIMTSYNKVNGVHTACNYDLNTTILRGDWGYTGFVMTDWWTGTNCDEHLEYEEHSTQNNRAPMVRAQNDVYMIVGNGLAGTFDADNIRQWLDEGKLTRGELQRNAMNVCRYAMSVAAFEHYAKIGFKPADADHEYKLIATFTDIKDSNSWLVKSDRRARCIVKMYVSTPADSLEQYSVVLGVAADGAHMRVLIGGTQGKVVEARSEIGLYEGDNWVYLNLESGRDALKMEKVELYV